MQIKGAKRPSAKNRFLKLTLTVVSVVIIAILGLHVWFVFNARGVLRQTVKEKSGGKLELDLSELSFDLFDNKIKIREADLISTDTLTQPTTYRVKFRKLTLRVNSFWPLLLQRKLLLDSIKLHDPEVTVYQWKKDTALRTVKDELSISQQMGRLYNSMLNALEDFGIRRIIINNAKVSLVNKMKAASEPVVISNIYFSLIRNSEKAKKRDAFIPDEQTVDLNTTDQNIALPSGRHRLAFKNFKLELFRKRIEIDSCTVTATTTESSKSNYRIFFKKLLLVGVDFDALYRYNLIKADSVYCENPLFNITLNTLAGDPSAPKKERPDPEKIIRELTGDLDLAFVGVKDAGIHINITGKKERSLFNSNKDDFEMRGLRINGDSSKPVVVQRFDMLVQDYHLYNEDSSSRYKFDSIHFINNKIVLNNFTMLTAFDRGKRQAKKDFTIPYFQLTGLNWYELIFNQNFVAKEALLYNPVINMRTIRRETVKRKNTSFFRSLHTMDDQMTLGKLTIINGQANLKLGRNTELNLHHLNLDLNSNELLRSNNSAGLRRAVEQLSFTQGDIRFKDITIRMKGARYTGSNLIRADQLLIDSKDGSIKANVQKATIDNLLLNDEAERVELNGLHWQSATIALSGSKTKKAQPNSGSLLLKNISGTNTSLQFSNNTTSAKTYLKKIEVASIKKEGAGKPYLQGLLLSGNSLVLASKETKLAADNYTIRDGASTITGLKFSQIKSNDSTQIEAPRIDFTADINGLLQNEFHLKSLEVSKPVVNISKWQKTTGTSSTTSKFVIDRVVLKEPAIQITTHRNDSVSIVHLPSKENSKIIASGLRLDDNQTSIGQLVISTTAATFTKPSGEVVGVEKGKLELDISDLRFSKTDSSPTWSGLINKLNLQTPTPLSLGKKGSQLVTDQLALGNLRLSSAYLSDMNQLIKSNVTAWLHTATGQLIDSTTTLKWYNASYSAGTKTLRLDSMSYHPTASRDSVMQNSPYQTDYITLNTGAVQLEGFNLDQYKKDTAIIARSMTVANPIIVIYRDKSLPVGTGSTKPLPVNMIRRIPFPVNLGKVNLSDGLLSYTEKNRKTGAEGTLVLTRLNGGLQNIKNRDYVNSDSLQFTLNAWLMDSAEINLRVRESYTDSLNGFLMTMRMKPTTLSFLNPVIAPLSNVTLTSGTIDSLQIRAIGKEDLALGEMQMYYHDLKIKLVKAGDPNKSSFTGKIASFLANALLIKKNNNGRTGLIYYERDKSRSFFNYLIRMTFSGMATSIGVKKNRKYIKQYERQLQQRNLPPIDLE